MEEITYETYPARMIAATLLLNILIYALGIFILAGFGPWMAGFFAAYCLWLEVRVMRSSCPECYYYGKACAFGRGTIAAFLFKRRDPARFAMRTISHKQLFPDLLVLVFPMVGGVVLLVRAFSWSLAVLLFVLPALSLWGTYLVRSRIACRYCKQREIGCPAEKFFSRTNPG